MPLFDSTLGPVLPPIFISRGVTQDDPHFPILLDMVMNDLIDSWKVLVLACRQQYLLFQWFVWPTLNSQKSVANGVRSVIGKQVLFATSVDRFFVEGRPLKLLPDEFTSISILVRQVLLLTISKPN